MDGSRLIGCGAAWLLGVGWHLQERTLWPWWAYVALCVAGGLAGIIGARWWRRAWPLLWMGVLLMAVGASGCRASLRLADGLPADMEGADIVVTGVVSGLPQSGPAGLRFRFEVTRAESQGRAVQVPALLSLGWYKGFGADQAPMTGPMATLRAGQAWRFTVRLRRPHGNVNPHGFDHELSLFEQGVRATGYVRSTPSDVPVLIDPVAAHPVDRWRQQVRDRVFAQVGEGRAGGVLAALTVGDQSAIDRDDWQVFRDAGVAHLMSISGLHVTMFGWLAGLLVMAAWRRSRRAMLRLPAQQAARWGGLAAAGAYAVFSGWGVPAQRTIWMLATVTVLQALGRRWPWPAVLLAAAVTVTACDPWALLQPGFWLSFMAVGLLMVSGSPPPRADAPASRRAWRRWLGAGGMAAAQGVRTQLIASVGLAPLTLICFQQLSLVGFLANLVAIPLITLGVTPLALLGMGWSGLWNPAAWLIQRFCEGLQWLASVPGAVWVVPVAPAWAQVAGLAAAALLLAPLPWRLRLLALPLALPVLVPAVSVPPVGRFELLAADVGQGTAVLVRTRHRLLLFDTGPQYSPENDAGQRVLLPLLQSRGEARIDRLMLSHRDIDHVGGAATLLKALPVSDMLSSLEPGHPLQAMVAEGQALRCEEGQSWDWDGVHFEVLHPQAADHGRKLKPNALSCVLRVSGQEGSALLTGDIERAQEARLVAAGAPLQSDILVVPHHGSRTSSTAGFLDAVGPKVAIIQAGYRNRFGHPVAEVLARLEARHVLVHQSASCGAWTWSGVERPPEGRCQRQVDRRYWHDGRDPME